MKQNLQITLAGLVQGVGMRPWILRRAYTLKLAGSVQNTADGVTIEIEGKADNIAQFLSALQQDPPPGACIERICSQPKALQGHSGFQVRSSIGEGQHTAHVPKDRAPCVECLREMRDPHNRRYRHPFISCVTCGPRFSIVKSMPFDRKTTSMSDFAPCEICANEYANPFDRRHHAQTISCFDCGPVLHYLDTDQTVEGNTQAFDAAVSCLQRGGILALKGVGGYQLVCAANSETGIARVRLWKDRQRKPLAVMVADAHQASKICDLSEPERAALCSAAAPIVIARRKAGTDLSTSLAPGLQSLGVMLPASPLHQILADALVHALVVTSANRGGEPVTTDDADAEQQLVSIADGLLRHNRQIIHMVDDSVLRYAGQRRILMRHARGFAPTSVTVSGRPGAGLALGGHMKSAAALQTGQTLSLLQHIGDLTTLTAQARLQDEGLGTARHLFHTLPLSTVRDLHPDYASTDIAQRLALPEQAVPHHVAHILSLVAEQHVSLPALGVAFDGTGLGTDNTIWGGEFLRISEAVTAKPRRLEWQRFGTILQFPLPGGEAAVREPRRAALGVAWRLCEGESQRLPACIRKLFSTTELNILTGMLRSNYNCPQTTSIGRLFDAVAAMLGYCARADYDGEAAMLLEQAATDSHGATLPPLVTDGIWDWRPLITTLLLQFQKGVDRRYLAATFHKSLASMIASMTAHYCEPNVLLSGGVFQNALLVQQTCTILSAAGKTPVTHKDIPPNDGGLSLGQAFAASAGLTELEQSVCV